MPRPVAECGTDGGYYRHLRTTKTPPCAPCLRAHAEAEAKRRADAPPRVRRRPTVVRARDAQGPSAADQAVDRATEIVCMVRDDGPDELGAFLDDLDGDAMYALVVTLAAMVPDDRTIEELLAWQRPALEAVS